MNLTPTSRVPFGRDLIIAGLVIGVSAVVSSLSPGRISAELAHRLLGVLMGLVVVAYSNAVPKKLPRRLVTRCNPSTQQDLRRFTGWSLVLGGLAYALAWLSAPIEIANLLSAALLGVALLLVLARVAWGMARGART